jgi:hypothetical protein
MEKIEITIEQLKELIETAIQFGIDSPELITNIKYKQRIVNWMVDNTIIDINNAR